MTNGIIGDWAIYNGTEWQKVDNTDGKVSAFTAYQTSPNPADWSPTDNVRVSGLIVPIAIDKPVHTLKLTNGAHITLIGQDFVSTRGIIATGSSSAIEGTGTLTAPAGASELVVHTTSPGDLFNIDTPITDNGAPLTLIKAGDGTLELHHPGSYTGQTLVTRGVLKTFFQTGDKPTQSQFSTMIDSTLDVTSGSQSIGSLAGEGSVVLGSSMLWVGNNNGSTTYSGAMSGAGGMTKLGDGTFTLAGASSYTGATMIDQGTLVLTDDGTLANTNAVKIKRNLLIERERRSGGFLVGGPAPLELEGGTLEVRFGSGLGRTDVQDVEVVYIKPGASTMTISAGPGTSGDVRVASLSRDGGSNINWQFQGGGALRFSSPPALDNGIIGPWATVNSLDWATLSGDDHHLAPFHAYQTSPDPATWLSSDNVLLNGSVTLSGDTQINTVLTGRPVGQPAAAGLGSHVLRVGGILDVGSGDSITGPGTLTAKSGGNTVVIHVIDDGAAQPFVISAPITDNGGSVGLLKAGKGTLSLTSPNSSFTGPVFVNEGTLAALSPESLGTASPPNPLILDNGTIKILGVWGSTHAHPIIINPGGATIDTNGFSATTGKISGTGALILKGAGRVTTTQVEQLARVKFAAGEGTSIDDGTLLRIAPSGGLASASLVSGLTTTGTGTFDLTDNKLIIRGNPLTLTGSAFASVTGMIASGRNGGAWNGSGIITSQTQAAAGNYTSLGSATAEDVNRVGQTFGGQTVEAGDILIMYTYGGDATLDGKINIDDYVKIDSGIAGGYTGWSNGDFNYDGKVNIDDYTTVIDANIGNQGPPFASAAGGLSAVTAVPEPAGVSIVLGPVVAALVKRRRRVDAFRK
jgi:autotransporter-associated beta strand protein